MLNKEGINIRHTTEWEKVLRSIRRQNREMLEKSLFELTAAYHIGKEATYTFDLERCLKILTDRIADLMSVEIVSIMLIDKSQRELAIKIAKGLDEKITTERVKLGQGIAGWIAKTGQPLLIKDITKDSRFAKRDGKYYTDSLLSVPLKIQDRVIGVINVNNKISKDLFREKDLDILKTVADLAAAAIESARIQQEAKLRDEVRLDFISNISHELRVPLTAINEAVGLILDGITGDVSQEQRKFLGVAKQNVDRLSRLVDELLELANVDAKIAHMKRSLFDIVGLTEGVVVALRPLGKDKKVSLKSELPDKEIKIWADPDKLSQVFTNLIDNAIKYNKPSGKVEIGLEGTGASVKIFISDTGIGMPEEDLDKIFDRFHRIEKHIKSQARGAGLGLSITREIVKKHGGNISVESKIGKGSKFTVTLPKDLRADRKRK